MGAARHTLDIGFLGAFATFSTAAVDAGNLIAAGRWRMFVRRWLGMFFTCTAAGFLGYLVACESRRERGSWH